MRIGILGGTFNPVHEGHVIAALDVCAALDLTRVIFMPAQMPPQKGGLDLVSGLHRFEMIRLAVSDHPLLAVSDFEFSRPGPSYTADTLIRLTRMAPAETEYLFLLGLDAFEGLASWHRPLDILKTVSLVVMTRPDDAGGAVVAGTLARVGRVLEDLAPGGFVRRLASPGFDHAAWPGIHVVEVTPHHAASRNIRRDIAEKRNPVQDLNPRVLEYIQEKGLYP